MDLALDRLNLARRRAAAGDKAIDGGICLEALLGDDNPQELTYRLCLRASLLLGTNLEECKKIREAVRQFYSLRSKIVHGHKRRQQRRRSRSCSAQPLDLHTGSASNRTA